TLSHRFSSEMGETMVQMKNRLRIQRAQELMADPARQLKEIAFEVGFEDPAYFTRLFTRLAGISPSEYRKLLLRGGRILSNKR
ncbi:MAG: AraC family transcriptional regulator, partial [Cupriavidus sp.]